MDAVNDAHALVADEVLTRLGTTARDGLSASEAAARVHRCRPNALRPVQPIRAWSIAVRQLRSLVVALLSAAAIVSASFGDWIEAGAIVAVIMVNAAIGFFTELGAVRSMEALHRL